MSANIAKAETPRDVSAELGSLFSYMDRLEEFEETVIELLPFGTDEEVKQARTYAMRMSNGGWRIVCACDAVLLSRTTALRGGRGHADIEGVGRGSVAQIQAQRRGVEKSTVYRNAQIFHVLLKPKGKTRLNVQTTLLDDKGYFEAALRAPDPRKALKMFEKEKSENPNFSVGDAFRLSKTLKENRPKIELPDQPNYTDSNLKTFLLDLEASLNSFKNRCPRPEFTVRLDSWIRATRFERARTPQIDFEAVMKQVDEGACTVEEIAEEVYLSPSEIKDFCVKLVGCEPPTKDEDPREAGTPYEWRGIGANTDVARGSRAQGIFRKDAPSGDDFRGFNSNPESEEEHY